MLAKATIAGDIELNTPEIVCVCSCGNNDASGGRIEFNFRDQTVYYVCKECKRMNIMKFGQRPTPPLPKTQVGGTGAPSITLPNPNVPGANTGLAASTKRPGPLPKTSIG